MNRGADFSSGAYHYQIGQRAYYDWLFKNADPSHSFTKQIPSQVREWQTDLRDVLLALLGLRHLPQVELAPRVVYTEPHASEHYSIEHVEYQCEPNFGIPALFFRPSNPRPDRSAVLAIHGEGSGVHDERYSYIREFARRGHYVLAPELRNFGARCDANRDNLQSRNILTLFGKKAVGLLVHECLVSLRYLLQRPEINPQLVGVCGMGLGAMLAVLTAGFDERVACVGITGFFSTFRDHAFHHTGDGYYVIPDAMLFCDIPDITGLIAPRPLIIEMPADDPSINQHEVLRALSQLNQIYEAYERTDQLLMTTFPGLLRFHGEQIYSWFSRWLVPTAESRMNL